MIDRTYLADQMNIFGFACTPEFSADMDSYARMLTEWNQKMNLTAITEPKEIVVKHFVDSLLLLKAADIPQGAKLIDVGTGAGFPSVPSAAYRRDIHLCLLDSLQKRINFLTELTDALSLDADCVHARAEEQGRNPDYREMFDVSCARAVAHLRELAEYCIPFVKPGGIFAALKGYEIEQELDEARYAVSQMGGKIEKVQKFELPDGSRRAIVIIRKVRQTPAKYPRPSAKMKKFPLQKRD